MFTEIMAKDVFAQMEVLFMFVDSTTTYKDVVDANVYGW